MSVEPPRGGVTDNFEPAEGILVYTPNCLAISPASICHYFKDVPLSLENYLCKSCLPREERRSLLAFLMAQFSRS